MFGLITHFQGFLFKYAGIMIFICITNFFVIALQEFNSLKMKSVKTLSLIVIILFATFKSGAQSKNDSIDYYILTRSYEKAAKLSNSLLSSSPENPDLMISYGISMQAMQEYEIALNAYKSALRQDSTIKAALYRMAECYEALGDKKEAIKTYDSILSADSSDIYSMQHKARLLISLRNFENALILYKKLLIHAPGNYIFNKNAGLCYYRLQEESKAADHLAKAWSLNKRDLSLPVSIANAYNRLKLPSDALYFLEEGLEYDSLNIPILKTAASIKYAMSNFEDAAAYLEKAYQQGDTSLFTNKYLGLSLFNLSRYEEAIPRLRDFYLFDTLNTEATYYLGLALTGWHMKDEGINYLQLTIDMSYPQPEFIGTIYAAMATAKADINQRAKAIEYYKKAITLDPRAPSYYLETGKLYDAKAKIENVPGHYKKALEYYESFLETRQPYIEQIMSERGLRADQISSPGMDYARGRIKKIKEELFFRGELEK